MDNEEKILGLYVTAQRVMRSFLSDALTEGFDLRITDAYRSIQEQNDKWAQGRTKPGNIVTYARGGESFHNFGLAIDIVDRGKGYNIDWEKLGRIGERNGLEWGGRWDKIIDKPHFQYTGGLSLVAVQNGARPGELLTQQDMKEIEELKNEIKALTERVTKLEENKIGENKAKNIAIGVVKRRVHPKKLWKLVASKLKK
jgi:peptidoglycan LD-endopeptidase CwlK